jgi:uncharacterized protein (TIGR02246 family)
MFSRKSLVATCAAAALLAACTAPAGKSDSTTSGAAAGTLAEPTVAEVRAAIEANNQKAAAGMLAGDMNAALSNYGDSSIMMMPGMPMMNGRAAIEAGMKGMMETVKVNAASFTTQDVMVSGDLAIETGTYDMTTTMKGGKPLADKGKYLTVWKRQADGSWKAIRDINNPDGTPPAGAK